MMIVVEDGGAAQMLHPLVLHVTMQVGGGAMTGGGWQHGVTTHTHWDGGGAVTGGGVGVAVGGGKRPNAFQLCRAQHRASRAIAASARVSMIKLRQVPKRRCKAHWAAGGPAESRTGPLAPASMLLLPRGPSL
jgi:hypothetical protein